MWSVDRCDEQKSINQQYTKAFEGKPSTDPPRPTVEQIAFPSYNTSPAYVLSPKRMSALKKKNAQEAHPARKPLRIARGRQRPLEPRSPSTARRAVVHIATSMLLLFIMVGTLIAVLPVGTDAKEMGSFLPMMRLIPARNNTTVLIAAQAATATAVTIDGYDPGGYQAYAGVQSAPASLPDSFSVSDIGDLSRFFYGQCTYWSNMRYRQLTGHWIPWLGNAYQWAYAAPAYGWIISAQPNPNGPSIVVLAPYTQGSGSFGHVGVVEHAVSSASNGVMTSNWNWGGRWATHDWVRFYPGPGVSFLWYPNS